jgi:acyl-CoA synthetase (AMP-forming)/AMP-acid ligase II
VAVEAAHDLDYRALVGELRPVLPALGETIWVPADRLAAGTRTAVGAIAGRTDGCAPGVAVGAGDPVAIVFTSGTTGAPKGAWFTHGNLFAVAAIESRRHPAASVEARERNLVAGLSFAHVGFMARLVRPIRTLAATIIHDTFEPGAVLATIARERLTALGGFPTQLVMLLDHAERPRYDLGSLRTVLIGGAPCPAELIRRIADALHVTVSIRYASTEVAIATASSPDDPPELLATTVGRATDGVELRIVDAERRPAGAGAVGEVAVRSPATMRGYWRNPEATAAVMDAGGWVHTGDLGFLDERGYLHLRGRKSEMYIRGGYNVHPVEVEDRLLSHPKVARAAVAGVPDRVLGEIGWAWVVPRDPADPPTLEELRAHVGAELASFKRPDGLSVTAELPVTAMFKVDKQVLVARWRDEHGGRPGD